MSGQVMTNNNGKTLSKLDVTKVFWRSFFLQASWNYERMQALGYAWTIKPALEKLYGNDEEGLKVAIERNLEFFNTQPYMALPIMGIALAMEEQRAHNPEFDESVISSMKVSLMGPLAGIGDSLFWFTVAPITLSIGISLSQGGNIFGVIMFLILFNIPHILVRYYGVMEGYKRGTDLFSRIEDSNSMQRLTSGATIVGLMVLGVMVATMVNFPLSYVIGHGEQAMTLQQILDGIMPNLLPIVSLFGLAALLKKGVTATKLLLGIIVVCVILAYFGLV